MIPFLIAGAVGVAAVWKLLSDDDTKKPARKSPKQPITTLEKNLKRLARELEACSGHKVAIIGPPGAGKSSLLKFMGGGKVKPPPEIGTHTDATDWSSDPGKNLVSQWGRIIVVDAPGYDTLTHPTSLFIKGFPFNCFDTILIVLKGKIHAADESVFRHVLRSGVRTGIARSHAESLDDDSMLLAENDLRARLKIPEGYPLFHFSNRTKIGIPAVRNFIYSNKS